MQLMRRKKHLWVGTTSNDKRQKRERKKVEKNLEKTILKCFLKKHFFMKRCNFRFLALIFDSKVHLKCLQKKRVRVELEVTSET